MQKMSPWTIQCNCTYHCGNKKPGLYKCFRNEKTDYLDDPKLSEEVISLHLAIREGRIDDVKKTMSNLQSPDIDVFRMVKEAIHRGMVCIVSYLVSLSGEDLNNLDEDGCSLLYWALSKADSSMLECLLKAGVDVNIRNASGKTPLHYAVSLKWISRSQGRGMKSVGTANYSTFFSEFLINNGANLEITDGDSFSPLHSAIWDENTKAVEILLKYHADINCNSRRGTPLHIAVQKQCIPIIHLLLNYSESAICSVDSFGDTPLHFAFKHKFYNIVDLFLTCVKNIKECINIVNTRNESVLHIAVQSANCEIVRQLIDLGADVNCQNVLGDTPLISVVSRPLWPWSEWPFHCSTPNLNIKKQPCLLCSVASILVEKGSDVNIHNRFGLTVFHKAIMCKQYCVMKILLNNSVDDKLLGNLTFVALNYVNNYEEISYVIKLFVDYGADINFNRDPEGWTPLHKATKDTGFYSTQSDRFFSYIALLLDLGANVNAIDFNGETPLHVALQIIHKVNISEIVTLFLQSGADVTIKSCDGVSPLDIVEQPKYVQFKESFHAYALRYIVAGWSNYVNIKEDCSSVDIISDEELYKRCKTELKLMKKSLHNNISLCDILCADDKALIDYLDLAWNKEVISSNKYLNGVNSLYAPIICSKVKRINRIKERQRILNSGEKLLNLISKNFNLRKGSLQDCFSSILKYLNFNDFKNIDKSFDESLYF